MNRTRASAAVFLILAVAALGAWPQAGEGGAREARPPFAALPVPLNLPGQQLPVSREYTYRMAGKIRALVLWVGRDDVGSAVIKWRGTGEHKAFELLIGTDPQKAPSQMNKWGFLVEEIHRGESAVVGLISQENDDRLSDVKADLKHRKDLRAFDTIRGHVTAVGAMARVGTLHAPSELTYQSAATVLDHVLGDTSLPVKQLPRAGGVRAGFLSALSELMAASIERSRLRGFRISTAIASTSFASWKLPPFPDTSETDVRSIRSFEGASRPAWPARGRERASSSYMERRVRLQAYPS